MNRSFIRHVSPLAVPEIEHSRQLALSKMAKMFIDPIAPPAYLEPTSQEERNMAARLQNAQTWKQVTTNLPHDMYRALRRRVNKDISMSQLLRELIADSDLIKAGNLPRPSWSVELMEHIVALRAEIAAEKQVRDDAEKAVIELRKEIAELRKNVISPPEKTSIIEKAADEAPLLALFNAAQAEKCIQPKIEKPTSWPIFGKLTELFAGVRN